MAVYEQKSNFFSESSNLRNKKPLPEIEKMLFHLTPFSNTLETQDRQVINYMDDEKRKCFLLHKVACRCTEALTAWC